LLRDEGILIGKAIKKTLKFRVENEQKLIGGNEVK
jgi:hypothetical protein